MKYDRIRLVGLNTVDLGIQSAQFDDVFILKGADGLGPAEIDVSIEGDYFQNKVPQNKLPIFRIGLNPAWDVGQTPEELREILYGLLTGGFAGDQVAIILLNVDVEVCRIYGYASKFEIVPFSDTPEVQVTFECLSPYFTAPAAVTPDLLTLDTTTPVIENVGSGPTGFHLKLTFAGLAGPLASFEIQSPSGRRMRIVPPGLFHNGDQIELNTNLGSKTLTIWVVDDLDLLELNGLPYLTSDSEWLQLYGGTNTFTMTDPNFTWDEFEFTPKFWGV